MKIRITEDGSHTLFCPIVNESYHSEHGAIQESEHIFINAAWKHCAKTNIKILEVGFGTGLNAFLTLLNAEREKKKVEYSSFEYYPLDILLAKKLNYAELLDEKKKSDFIELHAAEWNKKTQINAYFCLEKIKADFTKTELLESYDLIYFDAFSPEKQSEMWTQECFDKLYAHANEDAVLTTYCAKGSVRRSLQKAGFSVSRLPGPPGKREILQAKKI